MKRSYLLVFALLVVISLNAQLKSEWRYYGNDFSYVDSQFSDNKFSLTGILDYQLLPDGTFIFSSSQSPITIFKNGKVTQLEKLMVGKGAFKSNMSTANVKSFVVDKGGSLWFSMEDGLYKVEAAEFNYGDLKSASGMISGRQINEADGFPYSFISALGMDSKGNIWVRGDDYKPNLKSIIKDIEYQNGIAKFNGTSWTVKRLFGFHEADRRLIAFDEKDIPIVQHTTANRTSSFSRFADDNFSQIGDQLEFTAVQAMDYSDGVIYFTNTEFVKAFRDGKWQTLFSQPGAGILDLKVDKDKTLWLATNQGVIMILPNGSKSLLNVENSILPTNIIRKIAIDDQNRKWFITDSGIVGYKPWQNTDQNSLYWMSQNSEYPKEGKINMMAENGNDLLMVHSDKGLLSYDGSKINTLTPSSMREAYYTDMSISKNGVVYVGSNRYLHKYDGKTYQKLEWQDDIGKQVYTVLVDDKDQVWIASDGISYFDGTKWKNFNKKNGDITSNTCYKLFKDSKGNIWAALADGLARYDGNIWTNYNKKSAGIGLRNMTGIAETATGKLWFSNGFNLVEFDGTTMKEVETFKSVGSLRNMFLDTEGTLFISTEDKGVAKFKDGVKTLLNQSTGLPSNAITNVYMDKNNRLWLAFGVPPQAPTPAMVMGQTPAATPAPAPAPTPKEVFIKKLQSTEITNGLLRLSKF